MASRLPAHAHPRSRGITFLLIIVKFWGLRLGGGKSFNILYVNVDYTTCFIGATTWPYPIRGGPFISDSEFNSPYGEACLISVLVGYVAIRGWGIFNIINDGGAH